MNELTRLREEAAHHREVLRKLQKCRNHGARYPDLELEEQILREHQAIDLCFTQIAKILGVTDDRNN